MSSTPSTRQNGGQPAAAPSRDIRRHSQFESFFKLWEALDRQGVLIENNRVGLNESVSGHALEAQTNLMELVAALRSSSLEDLAYKLALWRWDAPDIDDPSSPMTRSELVAYSAFRDAVRLTGLESLMKPADIETDFYKDRICF